MDAAIWVAVAAFAGTLITAAFAFVSSRRGADDSHAISLINAGQVALEAALARATLEILDARSELAKLRADLAGVRRELSDVLGRVDECERERLSLQRQLAKKDEQ